MAVRRETTIHRFRGLSTDEKPGRRQEDGSPVQIPPMGSVFVEVDTGARYVWTGSWPWVRQEQTIEMFLAELIDTNAQILETLAAIQRGHEMYLWEDPAPPE